jgi:hypothetical protein
MVELIDAGRYLFDKEASSFGEPYTSRVALEQEDAKFVLKRLVLALTLDWVVPSAWAAR